MDILKKYVEQFNNDDENIYINDIDNPQAYEWLKNEIPLFECSDQDIERTYYFRYWTYRKHVKNTEDGYVITEFLPKVRWGDKNNAINAAVGHLTREGRWLKNSAKYNFQNISYFLNDPKSKCVYSAWMLYALWELWKVRPEIKLDKALLDKMCRYYEFWEETHQLKNKMFWSIDGYDAMEYSISGMTKELKRLKGVRPTLNSYMCADAYAIYEFARLLNENEIAEKYLEKHEFLKKDINEKLWKDGFYRAYHYDTIEELEALDTDKANDPAKELIGYIPWMFGIPPKDRTQVFDMLLSPEIFYTDFGLATADKSHERFLYEANHGCLWNGYVWPFATAQTLTALINVIRNYSNDEKYKNMFTVLLKQYARSHTRVRKDGKVIPWIDEVRHPFRDEWYVREKIIQRDKDLPERTADYERGKDYNHSTFCDLVISGLVGVSCENSELTARPCVSDEIEWFRLSNLYFNGKNYTVTYDKTGEKYGLGKGVFVECNE